MTIRPYANKDKENVRFVHLNSEGPCKSSKRGINFGLAVYCDYYIEKEPENCFVAVDENDRAVGYIICTEDFDKFYPVFVNEYYTRIKKWEFKRRKSALRSVIPHEKYKGEYPAHLHIDVLPEYQRMGLGHKMTDVLLAHLKEKGVKGIMLTTWIKNKKGRGFYDKYGFTLLEEMKNCAVYGIKLS
ncbi:MAG: GNAT family N-acetyltransferase [Clostridia bacterium]|nr:GNAT family N-acetyltransferase [Clostridia bacterium]